ncbi:helix-turn-helix domain-containing protein [Lysinibacillus sp. 54212]|uniref:helix-turn-helix domain-containing protein n=1 Tax=Lysinibacillus sp. 54212 TaxID=3119829 RepID=UPI002FC8E408
MRNNLRIILAKRKLNISQVAELTGLSRNTISSLYHETAKGVQFQTLEALCFFLECKVGDLFEIEKEAV